MPGGEYPFLHHLRTVSARHNSLRSGETGPLKMGDSELGNQEFCAASMGKRGLCVQMIFLFDGHTSICYGQN